MSDEPTARQIIAELRSVLEQQHDELDRHRHAFADAAQVLMQRDARIGSLDAQLGLALVRIAELEAAIRQAGHAMSCALQYGGACDCRMQLVRRSGDGL